MGTIEISKVTTTTTLRIKGAPVLHTLSGSFNPLKLEVKNSGIKITVRISGPLISGYGAWRTASYSLASDAQNTPPEWVTELLARKGV